MIVYVTLVMTDLVIYVYPNPHHHPPSHRHLRAQHIQAPLNQAPLNQAPLNPVRLIVHHQVQNPTIRLVPLLPLRTLALVKPVQHQRIQRLSQEPR